MIRGRRTGRALAMLSLVLLLVAATAGCGGSSSNSTPSVLSQVLQRGTLRVGTITAGAPYESLDSTGQLVGYDIDLANEMAKELGPNIKVEFTQTDLAGRISLLQTGKVDVVLANLSMTPARAETVAFTDPYSLDTLRFMVSANSNFKSLSDLKAAPVVRMAMTRGVAYEPLVKQILPNAQVTFYTSDSDIIQALDSGQADAVAMDDFTEGAAAAKQPGHFLIFPGYIVRYEANIGVPLGDFTWWLWCNTFVRNINGLGINYTLYEKWIGGPVPSFILPSVGESS